MSMKQKAILFSYRHDKLSRKISGIQASVQDLKKSLSYVAPKKKK